MTQEVVLTEEILDQILPSSFPLSKKGSRGKELLPYINRYFKERGFTVEEAVYFLGNCLWECGFFFYLEEGTIADGYSRPGEQYEGRKDLGNTEEGDGVLFVGRGMIQLTGRAIYTRFAHHIDDLALLEEPSRVASDPNLAVLTAIFYWTMFESKDTKTTCRDVACVDGDNHVKINRISGIINWGREYPKGKVNHLKQRIQYTERAARALGVYESMFGAGSDE